MEKRWLETIDLQVVCTIGKLSHSHATGHTVVELEVNGYDGIVASSYLSRIHEKLLENLGRVVLIVGYYCEGKLIIGKILPFKRIGEVPLNHADGEKISESVAISLDAIEEEEGEIPVRSE